MTPKGTDPKLRVHDGDVGLAIKFGVVTAAPDQHLLFLKHPLPVNSTPEAPHFVSMHTLRGDAGRARPRWGFPWKKEVGKALFNSGSSGEDKNPA